MKKENKIKKSLTAEMEENGIYKGKMKSRKREMVKLCDRQKKTDTGRK